MELRAKLYVIASSAGIAKQRFSSGPVSTCIAILHQIESGIGKNNWSSSPSGRSQIAANGPWDRKESIVVNQKTF